MRVKACVLGGIAVLAWSASCLAQNRNPTDGRESYDDLLAKYLREARAGANTTPAPDSAWAWVDGLAFDNRARRVNDLLTIQVLESSSASGSADAELAKASGGSAGITNLFGVEKHLKAVDPSALAAVKSNTNFKGSGTTTRAGELTANLTARVVEMLPNGDLVVEGVREIEINGDRQVLVLTGVVRPADISPSNVVRSTAVGQLRIRYFGQGLMKDNLKPGWLVRVLNKVF